MKNLVLKLMLLAVGLSWFTGFLWAVAPAVAAGAPTTVPSSDVPRALLAHGDHDHFWIARILSTKTEQGVTEQTQLMFRGGYGDPWNSMPSIASRVVSLASSAGELFVVLSNGQCMILDDQESRLAPGPPQGGAMIAAANDRDALWAIMLLNSPSTVPSATQPDSNFNGGFNTSLPATGSNPATPLQMFATTMPSSSTDVQSSAKKLMALRLEAGKWVDPQSLPIDADAPLPAFSLAVADQRPIMAWRNSAGAIVVSRLGRDHRWSAPLTVVASNKHADFKLELLVSGQPVLWVSAEDGTAESPTIPTSDGSQAPMSGAKASGNASSQPSAGVVYEGENFSRQIPLRINGSPPPHPVQTVVVAFERLRWLASNDDKPPFEQAYELDGKPLEVTPVAVVAKPPPPMQSFIVAALAVVLLATGAAMMHRRLATDETSANSTEVKPILAPLSNRMAAGLVDLIPVIGVLILFHNPLTVGAVALGVATYLAHTLAAELICGQSLGKMLLGLRVVTMSGEPPAASAIIIRNLLRFVDLMFVFLPLLVTLFNPQRQRLGDLAAKTIVVIKPPEAEAHETE